MFGGSLAFSLLVASYNDQLQALGQLALTHLHVFVQTQKLPRALETDDPTCKTPRSRPLLSKCKMTPGRGAVSVGGHPPSTPKDARMCREPASRATMQPTSKHGAPRGQRLTCGVRRPRHVLGEVTFLPVSCPRSVRPAAGEAPETRGGNSPAHDSRLLTFRRQRLVGSGVSRVSSSSRTFAV